MKTPETQINLIFDFDSTLVSMEGIDFLGDLKGIGGQIAGLTDKAMAGEISLGDVFLKRLELIRPTLDDLKKTAKAYIGTITPGFEKLYDWAQSNQHRLFVVSGGYLQTICLTTDLLGLNRSRVYANELLFNDSGEYQGLVTDIPLWQNFGKTKIVEKIKKLYPGITLCVGDGMNDYEAGLSADGFICFAGHVYRQAVAEKADEVVTEADLSLIVPAIENFLKRDLKLATASASIQYL